MRCLAVQQVAQLARLIFGHQQLGGLEPLQFRHQRRVAVGFQHREAAGGQIQPGEAVRDAFLAGRGGPPRRAGFRGAARAARRRSRVPGVTTRTTWRSTGPLDFAGSPICSQMRHRLALAHQARQIGVDAVIRHARHRDRLAGRCPREVSVMSISWRRAARRRRRARRSRPCGRTAASSGARP